MSARTVDELVSGSITAESRGDRLILTTFKGRTDRTMALEAAECFERLVATMDRPVWVSETTELTGFDPSTLVLGARWFSAFKGRGGRDCLVVSKWDKSIMAARAMALGLGVRVRNHATLAQALDAAAQLLKEP